MSYLFRLQARARTTSILVRAFWNFKLPEEVFLQYSRNCISQYILVAKAWHPLTYIHNLMVNATQYFWKCKNFEIFPMMKVLEKKSNFGKLLGPKVFRIIKSSKYFRKCKNFEIFPMMLNIWMVFKKKIKFRKTFGPKSLYSSAGHGRGSDRKLLLIFGLVKKSDLCKNPKTEIF